MHPVDADALTGEHDSDSCSMNPSSLSSDDRDGHPEREHALHDGAPPGLPCFHDTAYELSHTAVSFHSSPPAFPDCDPIPAAEEALPAQPKRLTYEDDLVALVDMVSEDGTVRSDLQHGLSGLTHMPGPADTSTVSAPVVMHPPEVVVAAVSPAEPSDAARHRPPATHRPPSPHASLRDRRAVDASGSAGVSILSLQSSSSRRRARSRTPSPLRVSANGTPRPPLSSGEYSTEYTNRSGIVSARDAILRRNYVDLERNWRSPGRGRSNSRSNLRYSLDPQGATVSPALSAARHSAVSATPPLKPMRMFGTPQTSLQGTPLQRPAGISPLTRARRRASPSPAPPLPAAATARGNAGSKSVAQAWSSSRKAKPSARKSGTAKARPSAGVRSASAVRSGAAAAAGRGGAVKRIPSQPRRAAAVPQRGRSPSHPRVERAGPAHQQQPLRQGSISSQSDLAFRKCNTDGVFYRSVSPLRDGVYGRTQTQHHYTATSFRTRSRSRSPLDTHPLGMLSVGSERPSSRAHRSATPKSSRLATAFAADTQGILSHGGAAVLAAPYDPPTKANKITERALEVAVEAGRREEVHELKMYVDGVSRKIQGVLRGAQSSRRKARDPRTVQRQAVLQKPSAPPLKASQVADRRMMGTPRHKARRDHDSEETASDATTPATGGRPSPRGTGGQEWQALLKATPLD